MEFNDFIKSEESITEHSAAIDSNVLILLEKGKSPSDIIDLLKTHYGMSSRQAHFYFNRSFMNWHPGAKS